MGAKIPLNGTSKVNRHTDVRTNRLIESIGPKGRCFENVLVVTKVSTVYPSMLKNFTLVMDIHMAGSNAVFQTLQI